MLKPVLVEAPYDHPIELSVVKSHLGIYDTNEFDDIVELYISVAVDYLDGYSGVLGIAILEQTWRQDYGWFPYNSELILPKIEPVTSIESIKYYDTDNTQQTFSSSYYSVFTGFSGAYIKLNEGVSWPDTYPRDDAVSVTFKAGYCSNDQVPASIKSIILLLVSHWFANREAVVLERGAQPTSLPLGVDALISKFKPPIY